MTTSNALTLYNDDPPPYCGSVPSTTTIPWGNTTTYFWPPSPPRYAGNKPLVVCDGHTEECEDLASARDRAADMAHQYNAEAFILKPVRKVKAKRSVTVTEIR